uniref:F-box domain-containing protein n=1 Tax=Ananas comosus var. bracteatus TaxID=296719 RepID=A0A6V7NFJ5_ANACO|nr:unnamed protein product [Ananas comosus var. bracteatus]
MRSNYPSIFVPASSSYEARDADWTYDRSTKLGSNPHDLKHIAHKPKTAHGIGFPKLIPQTCWESRKCTGYPWDPRDIPKRPTHTGNHPLSQKHTYLGVQIANTSLQVNPFVADRPFTIGLSESSVDVHGRELPLPGFSWLVKSCIPDPRHHISPDPSHPPPPPPPRNPTGANPAPPSDHDPSPIAALPDDLLLACLSRVPPSSLPSLPLVSRRFSRLLLSPSFLPLRRSLGHLCPSLLSLSLSPSPNASLSSASLPLITASPSPSPSPASWCVSSSPLPLPLHPSSSSSSSSSSSFSHARAVALGRFVYLIGRAASLRLDLLTGSLSPRAPTLFPRRRFAAAAVAGKIYVAGGSARARAVEEYDPAADAWRVVAEAPRRRYGCVGAAAAGVFYVAGGLGIGGDALDARACAGSVDAFLVGAGAWVRPRPSAGAAAAVPGAGASRARAAPGSTCTWWRATRWSSPSGGGRGGPRPQGGWTRLEPPPVPGRFRLGGALRFSCAAVGADKVAALIHVAAVRGGAGAADATAAVADAADGAVLVYDIPSGGWTRGPDLPPGFRRAACVGVEY